ncbi:MAG: hypothetical protein ACH36C_00005, partial [Ilumatobacteraceae bacterium]
MSREITCHQFFDGNELHGPRRVVFADDGLIESIDKYVGIPECAVVCPGFVDIQMNGFDDVHVANASTQDLQRLDQNLFANGTTSWLGTIVTAPLDKMSFSLDVLQEAFQSGQV